MKYFKSSLKATISNCVLSQISLIFFSNYCSICVSMKTIFVDSSVWSFCILPLVPLYFTRYPGAMWTMNTNSSRISREKSQPRQFSRRDTTAAHYSRRDTTAAHYSRRDTTAAHYSRRDTTAAHYSRRDTSAARHSRPFDSESNEVRQ